MINTFVNYNICKDSWYSPKEILSKFEDFREVYKDKINHSLFKRAREMFTGAVTLLGAHELSPENQYYLQANNQDTSPDVMAVKQKEQGKNGILLEISQLEMTEFENHFKSDDIVEFLKATKLPPKNDYGQNVMIVCTVNRQIPLNHKEIYEKIKNINPKSTIYIIGREVQAKVGDFLIFSVWPLLTKPINFNVNTTANKYWIPERVSFNLGIEEKITYEKAILTPVNTYEILGLDQEKIYKKFGKPVVKVNN